MMAGCQTLASLKDEVNIRRPCEIPTGRALYHFGAADDKLNFLTARSSATTNHRRRAAHGHQRAGFRRGRRVCEVCEFLGVRLQVSEETLELALHGVHLFSHVEDDFDAREIDAQIARE
jgi:hypothetical protein